MSEGKFGPGTGTGAGRRPARPPGRAVAETPRVSLVVFGLLLAGATAGVFLAGGPPQGSLGIFLLCAGAALTFCPPQAKVEWRLWLAAAALVGCGALAFLPERWFGVPAWRRTLEAAPAIHLPATITAVPWETGFWLAMLALTLLTGLFLLAHPIRSRWLLAFALTAALAAGAYGTLAIYTKETGWHYPFASDATFGFFPNRNHTATFLFVGSLLALGVLSIAPREGRWFAGLLAAGIIAICVVALGFFSGSRGGVVFLLVGVVLWVAGLGGGHRDRKLVVSLFCVLLAGGILFFVSGSEVRDRLLGKVPSDPVALNPLPAVSPTASAPGTDKDDAMHNLSAEFRLKIYRDAFDVVRDFPLTGTGLGTFALVFPQYRHASLSEAVAIHPESDWLMLTAESGIPALLCLLALFVLALRRVWSEREHLYWPLRWGCAVAVGAAVLHGLVDVPLHRTPLGWWVLIIVGLALQSARFGGGRSRAQHALFVVGGVAALVFGVELLRAQWFGGTPLPPFAYAVEHERFYRTVQHDRDGALLLAGAMIRKHPLENEAYLCLGQTYLLYYESDSFVDDDFKAQRLLDPNRVATPLIQGNSWLRDDPTRAAALWINALARRVRVLQATGEWERGRAASFFGDLVRNADDYPEVQKQLWREVRRGPGFAFAWLENVAIPLARDGISRLSLNGEFVRGLDAVGKRRFLRDWYKRGDYAGLVTFLGAHPDWQAAGWPVQMRQLADAQQYERAVRETAAHYGLSIALSEPGSAPATMPLSDEQEAGDPVGAFMAYWKMGNTRSARRVLDEAVGHATPSPTAEVWQLKTLLAAHDANWPLAWGCLQNEINLDHPDDAF